MKRRSFLKALLAAPGVAYLDAKTSGPDPKIDPELGKPINYSDTKFAKSLWPGIKKWYGNVYREVGK